MKLFTGHYRALEAALADELPRLRSLGRLAVVSAGRIQQERIETVLLERFGTLVNVDFMPTFPALARRVLPGPEARDEQPSPLARVLLGLEAIESVPPGLPYGSLRGNVRAAASLAGFLEDLLDRGVSPGAYSTLSRSLCGQASATELAVGMAFEAYASSRSGAPGTTADQLVEACIGGGDWGRYAAIAFYGYYDLNPLQRRLVRLLRSRHSPEILFFDPLVRGVPSWGMLGSRTFELLEGCEEQRPDARIAPGSFCTWADTMFSSPACTEPPTGFGLAEAGGISAAARTVIGFLEEALQDGIPFPEIAVVGREPVITAASILARAEGFPVGTPIRASAASLPEGSLVSALLEARRENFHYLYLSRLVDTGALDPGLRLTQESLSRAVSSSGIRFGLADWLAADPGSIDPGLRRLLDGLSEMESRLAVDRLPDGQLDAVFSCALGLAAPECAPRLASLREALGTGSRDLVSAGILSDAVLLALESVEVELGAGAADGVRFIPPEHARGACFRAVCITGLEEGVMPSVQREDARLSPELAAMLELPGRGERERAEAFLLRQAMEAASEKLMLVYRTAEPDGGAVAPSPFIDGLLERIEARSRDSAGRPAPAWFSHRTSDPPSALFGGRRPGQTACRMPRSGAAGPVPEFHSNSVGSERARLSVAFSDRDGVITPSAAVRALPGGLRVSDLTSWQECPFRFLARRVWGVVETEDLGSRSVPDPRQAGSIMHSALELIFGAKGIGSSDSDVDRAVREAVGKSEFARRTLPGLLETAESYIGAGVREFLKVMKEEGWIPERAEVSLEMPLGESVLRGKADLVARDCGGRTVLLDFKSGARRTRNRVLEEIAAGKDLQVILYRTMLALGGIEADVTGYVYRDSRRGEQPVFEAGEIEGLAARTLDTALGIERSMREGFFPPRPEDSRCGRCDLGALCRAGSRIPFYDAKWALLTGAEPPSGLDGRTGDDHGEG
jgi:hypothetical protein